MLRILYPDSVPGNGFIYRHKDSDAAFQCHTIECLQKKVEGFYKANGLQFSMEEFTENLCMNSVGVQCEGELKIHGLGDVVHYLLKPAVKAIDAIAGTDLENCTGCAQRRAAMNRAVPL